MKKKLNVDARGHVTLAWRKNQQYTIFQAEEDADGTIHLIPLVLVPAVLRKPAEDAADVMRKAVDPYPGEPWRDNPWKEE